MAEGMEKVLGTGVEQELGMGWGAETWCWGREMERKPGKGRKGRRDTKCYLLFIDMGTVMGSIVAENKNWKQNEESGKEMKEQISGQKEIKLKVHLGKSFLLECCFLSCQQGSWKLAEYLSPPLLQ